MNIQIFKYYILIIFIVDIYFLYIVILYLYI